MRAESLTKTRQGDKLEVTESGGPAGGGAGCPTVCLSGRRGAGKNRGGRGF